MCKNLLSESNSFEHRWGGQRSVITVQLVETRKTKNFSTKNKLPPFSTFGKGSDAALYSLLYVFIFAKFGFESNNKIENLFYYFEANGARVECVMYIVFGSIGINLLIGLWFDISSVFSGFF